MAGWMWAITRNDGLVETVQAHKAYLAPSGGMVFSITEGRKASALLVLASGEWKRVDRQGVWEAAPTG